MEATAGRDSRESQLRQAIKAEGIEVPRELLARSTRCIVQSVAGIYALMGATVIWARLEAFGWAIDAGIAATAILVAQRHCQTMVHDLSHQLFSVDRARNDMLGNYLIAGLIGMTVENYRHVHFAHHAANGRADDPEYVSFDTVRERGGLLIYCLRYILLFEALRLIRKYYSAKSLANAGHTVGGKLPGRIARMRHILLCQAALVSVFAASGVWWLYPLWLYIAMSWSPLLSGLRFMVEHPGTGDLTVSTEASWIERVFFAPFDFNFHFEHHLWPSLPPYRLRAAHAMLKAKGFFDRHPRYLGRSYLLALAKS